MFPTYISKLTFTGRTNLRSTRIIRTTWRKRRARRTDVARTRLSFPCSVESDNFMQSDSKKTNAVTISVVKSECVQLGYYTWSWKGKLGINEKLESLKRENFHSRRKVTIEIGKFSVLKSPKIFQLRLDLTNFFNNFNNFNILDSPKIEKKRRANFSRPA